MLKDYLEEKRKIVDEYLDMKMPKAFQSKFGKIFDSMRYSVFAGGKRLRPILTILFYEQFQEDIKPILSSACAIELIHTYSLIHDDLPALDNDDYRRGKLSSHKQFDEATAILTGDSLLTLAFDWLTDGNLTDNVKVNNIKTLSRLAGIEGMIIGQVADLECENQNPKEDDLYFIHTNKTAALLTACCVIGAQSSNTIYENIEKAKIYGQNIGLAFQIVDDILDVVGDEDELGKSVGKDTQQNKLTFPALFGIDKSKEIAQSYIDKSKTAINDFNKKQILIELADYIIGRTY